MSGMSAIPLPVQIRLRTIEILIDNYGFVSRSTLCDLFGIGEACVSKDIKVYSNLTGNTCFYNRSTRRIEKLSNFKRVFA